MSSKVLFLSFCPTKGGVSTHQANQINYLLEKGAEVTFIDEFVDTTIEEVTSALSEKIKRFQVPLWSNRNCAKVEIEHVLRAAAPDLVILNSMGILALYAPLLLKLRRRLGFKLVFVHHSGIFTWKFTHLLMQLLCGIWVGFVNQQIFVSQFTRRYWLFRFPWLVLTKSRVVFNSVAITNLAPSPMPADSKIRVGLVGRLSKEKDPETFCQLARLATLSRENYEFHVYGEGNLSEDLRIRFADSVTFHGFKPSAQLFDEIDILVNSSPIENCPYVVLEAKARGIPLVSAKVGGLSEICEDGRDAVFATSRREESLLTALRFCANHLDRFRQGCLSRRELFSHAQIQPAFWDSLLH